MVEKLNIEFKQLRYHVKSPFYEVFNRSEKTILKDINGEFRGSELSAVMGPSGCGKSTLLNILSGFITSNVEGSIKVNGKPRDYNTFRKQSTYIMQEENLHSLLTLRETMNFSMKLKTGNAFNKQKREKKIMMILENLGLEMHVNTFVDRLSGGQQKRLSIALELVDDPLILFLDEPTTGLDSSASTQCIKLLKKLAQEGRTIVCTIHTPSALLFEMFDCVYALADGNCIYQGSVKNLVPFLKQLGLICPETFNPADFLLEIANNDYGTQNFRLTKKIENGINSDYRKNSQTVAVHKGHEFPIKSRSDFSSSFVNQVIQLTVRNMIFNKRDKSFMLMRLLVYITVGILMGIMYFNLGNEAKQMINIFKGIYLMVAFLMYTSLYSLTVRFPIDLPIIKREHFNRSYSVGAHYIALNLADAPILIVCSLLFTFIAYTMANHPFEDFRILTVLAIGLAMCFTSQAYGIFAGSLVELKLGLLFAALLLVYQIIFAGGLVFVKDVHSGWQWMFEISYMHHALNGYGSLILGFNRTKMNCDDMYCHFVTPQTFLTEIAMHENISKSFYSIAAIGVFFHVLSYLVFRYRLRH